MTTKEGTKAQEQKPGQSKTRILVYGNPLVPKDAICLQILPKLRQKFPLIEFAEFDAAEDLEKEGPDLTILDTVQGIPKVMVLSDIDSFEDPKRFSMHDFDLGQNLKLLKAAGILKSVKIIGVPVNYSEPKAVSEITVLLWNWK